MCHPGHISHNRSDRRVLKRSQGRPYETSSNRSGKRREEIKAYISPKHIEEYTIQVLCVTQATIEVIAKSWKIPKDVLMRRPQTYFAKVVNKLKPTYLPKTLNYIQYRLLCVTQATYREIKTIAKSWKSPKDVLMRRPPTYFAKVSNRLKPTYIQRTLKYIQFLCYVSPRPQ